MACSFQRRRCEGFTWNRKFFVFFLWNCINLPLTLRKHCFYWVFPLLNPLFFQDGASPIFVASQNGHINVVKYLISKGAQVNQCRLVRHKFYDTNITCVRVARSYWSNVLQKVATVVVSHLYRDDFNKPDFRGSSIGSLYNLQNVVTVNSRIQVIFTFLFKDTCISTSYE